jgi:O-antigen/teichoic acid export membrane protein
MLHGVSVGLVFLLNYVLIKIAGVSDYGAYVFVFNSINLLVNFCLLGIDTLLVKTVSVYDAAGRYEKLKGSLFFSLVIILLSAAIIGFVSTKVNFLFGDAENKVRMNWFVFSFFSLLMLSIGTLSQVSLQALKKIILSQAIEKVIRPLLLLITVVVLLFFRKITLTHLIWSNVLAISLTCIISFVLLYRQIGFKIKRVKPEYDIKEWSQSGIAFFMISVLYVLNSRVDIFFIGFLKGNREVGVYNILMRVSEIISFALVIINFVLTPFIARLFANGDVLLLQRMVTRSARVVLLIGLLLTALIMVFRNYILLFFGVDSNNASNALLILCLGQLINIFFGSVGVLLMMSGNEKFSILSLGVSVVFNVVLNVILIPAYGILGAAIATSGTLIVWNFLMYFFVRRKLHIRTTAIGIM